MSTLHGKATSGEARCQARDSAVDYLEGSFATDRVALFIGPPTGRGDERHAGEERWLRQASARLARPAPAVATGAFAALERVSATSRVRRDRSRRAQPVAGPASRRRARRSAARAE